MPAEGLAGGPGALPRRPAGEGPGAAAVLPWRRVRSSLILSRRDLDFLLHEWLDVETLTKRPRYAEHSRETFDAVLDLAEQIATEHFAPHNRTADENEPRMVDGKVVLIPEVAAALEVFTEAGLMAGAFDEALGGMQLPHTVSARPCSPGSRRPTSARRPTRSSPWPTPTCCSRTARRSRSRPSSGRWSRAAGSARWRSPSRRPARRWPTSPPAPSRRTTAPTG